MKGENVFRFTGIKNIPHVFSRTIVWSSLSRDEIRKLARSLNCLRM